MRRRRGRPASELAELIREAVQHRHVTVRDIAHQFQSAYGPTRMVIARMCAAGHLAPVGEAPRAAPGGRAPLLYGPAGASPARGPSADFQALHHALTCQLPGYR